MIALFLMACGTAPVDPVDAAPEEPGLAECSVCGMVVREQPAPRGQVVLREGQHLHFCSIGDLRAWLDAPSALGAPVATYVEVLPADQDPLSISSAPHPWVQAEDAWYVFGARRPGVMGLPVLTWTDAGVARRVAHQLGTEPARWSDVRATSFNAIPLEKIQ